MNKNVPKLAQKIDEFEVIPFLVSAAKIPLYLLGIWVTFSYVFWLCKGAADSLQHLPEMLIGLTCAIFAAEPTACKKLMSQEPEAVDTNEEQHCKEIMRELFLDERKTLLFVRRSSIFQNLLIWSVYPAIFLLPSVVLAGFCMVLLYLPIALLLNSSSPFEFLALSVVSFFSLLPLVLTWKHQKKDPEKYRKYWLTDAGIYSGITNQLALLEWSKINKIEIEKPDELSDLDYDEDNPIHNQVSLKSDDGRALAIPIKRIALGERGRFLDILHTHLPSELKYLRSYKILQKWFGEPDLIAAQELQIPSFTQIWEADLKSHIGRTNYVPLKPGQKLQSDRYEICDYLRSGGFCTTYSAKENSGKPVVIKESAFPVGLADDAREKLAELFDREARLIQRCNHPRIVRVLDFFQEQNREYLVLEQIDGITIATIVGNLFESKGGSTEEIMSESTAIYWGMQMADMLDYLHSLEPPIIHRDFTPDNLILHPSQNLHLIDFGAANEFIGNATGTLIGKQAYIAPEQFQGKATPQSDIYSMCASLYFILTGVDPLPLSESHPRTLRQDVSEQLDELITLGTQLDPSKRIGTAKELLRRLTAIKASREKTVTDQSH